MNTSATQVKLLDTFVYRPTVFLFGKFSRLFFLKYRLVINNKRISEILAVLFFTLNGIRMKYKEKIKIR